MNRITIRTLGLFCLLASLLFAAGCQSDSGVYNVRCYGATGDGKTLDTPAINDAIRAASNAGGGTVLVPAGNYLCYSIRLQNHVTIYLNQGAVIVAAGTPFKADYDFPEPNEFDRYEDFGHSHWHNSLIYGDGVHDVAIEGHGLIYGKGLSRGTGARPPTTQPLPRAAGGAAPTQMAPGAKQLDTIPTLYSLDDRADAVPTFLAGTTRPTNELGYPNPYDSLADGIGNKSIAMKNCYNVVLRDISILQGGHFGLLLTGVDNLTIDNMTIDTNRDGMDIDACRNVRVSNCVVNSPSDDGICLKSSYGLGVAKPCLNVVITNCYVTGGYAVGSIVDGTFRKHLTDWLPNLGGLDRPMTRPAVLPTSRPDVAGFGGFGNGAGGGFPGFGGFGRAPTPRGAAAPGRTGRIKFGTESNGGFVNIAITNCVFEDCQGLALESVDGGPIEDITIDNITMRDIVSVPIFIRLGNRARGPFAPVAVVRRINISNIVCEDLAGRYACVISGIPGHDIEDLHISNVRIAYPGDRLERDVTTRPAEMETAYPEPSMFRAMPAYGMYFRHVKNLEVDHVTLSNAQDDLRPAFWLEDVKGADFEHIKAPHPDGVSQFRMIGVKDFSIHQSPGNEDVWGKDVDQPDPAATTGEIDLDALAQ